MISLIEVVCPHCGARGQIMVPPIGSIVIGPCPQCHELVVVFCGKVLPLNKETMKCGSTSQKREHLLAVLMEYLEEKISQIAFDPAAEDEEDGTAPDRESDRAFQEPVPMELAEAGQPAPSPKAAISQADFDHFVNVDLKLLDNKDYFKAVFE